MSNDEPQAVTVCLPVDEDVPVAIADFDRDECAQCGTEVYVSQYTRYSQEQGVYPETLWCSTCAADHAEEEADADE